jgi:Ca-activated chloride channel family protein
MTRLLFCIIIVCCGTATTLSAQQKYLPKVNQAPSEDAMQHFWETYNLLEDTIKDPVYWYEIITDDYEKIINARSAVIFPAIRAKKSASYLWKEAYTGYRKPVYKKIAIQILAQESYEELGAIKAPLDGIKQPLNPHPIEKVHWIKRKVPTSNITGNCYDYQLEIDTCFWQKQLIKDYGGGVRYTQNRNDSVYVTKKYPDIYTTQTVWRIDSAKTANQPLRKKLFKIAAQYKNYSQTIVTNPATYLHIVPEDNYRYSIVYRQRWHNYYTYYNVNSGIENCIPIYPWLYANASRYSNFNFCTRYPQSVPHHYGKKEQRLTHWKPKYETLADYKIPSNLSWNFSNYYNSKKRLPPPPYFYKHPQPIALLQEALQKKYYYVGPINNILDTNTQTALRKYQEQHDTQSDYVSKQTLQALEINPYDYKPPKEPVFAIKQVANPTDLKRITEAYNQIVKEHLCGDDTIKMYKKALDDKTLQIQKAYTDATFKGGVSAWREYLQQYPPDFSHVADKTISGRISVSGVVNKQGYFIAPRIITGVSSDMNEAVLEWCYRMPRWQPAKQAGRKVIKRVNFDVYYTWNSERQEPSFSFSRTQRYQFLVENEFMSSAHFPTNPIHLQKSPKYMQSAEQHSNRIQESYVTDKLTEELINYHNYDYPIPADTADFSITTELQSCPWNSRHDLLLVGIQSKKIDFSNVPPHNWVFIEGDSHSWKGRYSLKESALNLLKDNMRPQDRLHIVRNFWKKEQKYYAFDEYNKRQECNTYTDSMYQDINFSAPTLYTAYQLAQKHFVKGGNNRIILFTGCRYELGIGDNDTSWSYIAAQAQDGIAFDVYTMDYYQLDEAMLQKCAAMGKGVFHHTNNQADANKQLLRKWWNENYIVAQNASMNITFNPQYIKTYRPIGYENRQDAHDESTNDVQGEGEIPANHTITVLYEIIRDTVQMPISSSKILSDTTAQSTYDGTKAAMFDVQLTYQKPHDTTTIKQHLSVPPVEYYPPLSNNFAWASSVAEFMLLVRDSSFKGTANYVGLIKRATEAKGLDPTGERQECITLMERWKNLPKQR